MTKFVVPLVTPRIDVGGTRTPVCISSPTVSVRVESGGRGPPGPPGSGVSYTHVQASPSALWVINHNLGIKPHVSVCSTGSVEVDAEIAHISENQLEVRFVQPFAGFARLSS